VLLFCWFIVTGGGWLDFDKCKIGFAYKLGKSRNECVPIEGTLIFDLFLYTSFGKTHLHLHSSINLRSTDTPRIRRVCV
jgi:hypothetical protein